MRHRYDTRGLVLARTPVGESSTVLTVLTPELGLVRGRAQGVRAEGAKLAPALATFCESMLVLVRGKEGWRIAGAVLEEPWLTRLSPSARDTAARVSGLLTRLVAGEVHDPDLFTILHRLFETLATTPDSLHESAEILAALRILQVLGFDAGEIPGGCITDFSEALLESIAHDRVAHVARINESIAGSGL